MRFGLNRRKTLRMADQTDIAAWWAGVAAVAGGIVTAIGAAIRGRTVTETATPERHDDVILTRLDELERRVNGHDDEFDDIRHKLEKVHDTTGILQQDVREALTSLRERRK